MHLYSLSFQCGTMQCCHYMTSLLLFKQQPNVFPAPVWYLLVAILPKLLLYHPYLYILNILDCGCPLTCSSIYPSRLPWPELQSCESIGCSKVCLILNIMELRWRSANGAKRAKQINAKNSTVMSLSRNHDQVARDNSHRCCEECHVETTFLLPTNQTKAQKEAYIYSSMRCLLIKIAPLVFTCHAVTSISLAPMSAVIWLAGCIHVINHVFTWENAL